MAADLVASDLVAADLVAVDLVAVEATPVGAGLNGAADGVHSIADADLVQDPWRAGSRRLWRSRLPRIAATVAVLIVAFVVVNSLTGVSTSDPLKTASSGAVTVRYQRPWREQVGSSTSADAPVVAGLLTSPRLILASPTAILAAGTLGDSAVIPGGVPPELVARYGHPIASTTARIAGHTARDIVDPDRGPTAGRVRGANRDFRHCFHLCRERPGQRSALLVLRPRGRRRPIGRVRTAAGPRRRPGGGDRPRSGARRRDPGQPQRPRGWIAACPRRGRSRRRSGRAFRR